MCPLLQVGRTEVINNNLDPCFERAFEVDYLFDEVQMIRFELYDIDKFDNKTESLAGDDFLGQLETTVAEVTMIPHAVLMGTSTTFDDNNLQ